MSFVSKVYLHTIKFNNYLSRSDSPGLNDGVLHGLIICC